MLSSKRWSHKNSSQYEDLDNNMEQSSSVDNCIPHIGEEIEMTSVAVVPDDTYTVAQAVNAFGFGKFQVKLSLFTGLCWMADSMEMTILSILSPVLHCEWHISRYQQALTTTIVFLGMMLSSTFWGNLSDRYGRKQALRLCAIFLFYYSLLSSFAPNFLWILFLRGLVGFAIGCVPQSVTLYAEFLPTKQRARCVVLLDCFWALGACIEVLLALVIMPTLGWKWLLALSTVPLLIFSLVTPWLPESARFHVATGQTEKALATLQKVASDNGKPMLLGRLVVDDDYSDTRLRGRIKDLLSPESRRTSLLLWFIWMVCAFCYYGVVLMAAELFEYNKSYCSEQITLELKSRETCWADCKELTTQDYMDLLWTSLAEFPGIFVTIFVIEKCGRKNTMALQFFLFTTCVCFLFICTSSRIFLTTMLFITRGIAAGVFQAAYVYTPEVYPTQLRSVGVGTCSAMARLGAMVTPYVAQVLMQSSLVLAMSVYGITALLAGIACLLLPIETKGKDMKEYSQQ
ncbi:synaptic vesicle 2-related protein [Bacillus rossius redtenbacheri]|uniref:synaptic vesicle 2-related protein n=1 Tax=Bacillus rossius redtenbacheri TaxID=93214 RepID=UPI002FDE7E52